MKEYIYSLIYTAEYLALAVQVVLANVITYFV